METIDGRNFRKEKTTNGVLRSSGLRCSPVVRYALRSQRTRLEQRVELLKVSPDESRDCARLSSGFVLKYPRATNSRDMPDPNIDRASYEWKNAREFPGPVPRGLVGRCPRDFGRRGVVPAQARTLRGRFRAAEVNWLPTPPDLR